MKMMRSLLLLTMLGLSFLLTGCATNPATGKSDLVFMSESQEIALGRQYHEQILKQYEPYEDAELQAYVQEVGDRVARVSHRSNLYYRFTVLDSPEINAFALPGGYIYIHRGLMAYMNSEAQLAAVLAHEVGHVTARHAVRRHTSQTLAGIATMAVTIGTGYRELGDLAGLAGQIATRGYGREHELESDGLGAEYLAQSGYDPNAMVEVIGVLKMQSEFAKQQAVESGEQPQAYHGLFATHPRHDTRLQEVVGRAGALAAGMQTEVGEQRFLQMMDGVEFGDSTRAGVRRRNHFYHKELAFALSFPEGWRIQNFPQAIVGHTVKKEGVVQVTVEDLNKRLSPIEFMQQRLGVKKMRAGKDIRQHGLDGYTAIIPAAGKAPLHRLAVLFYQQRAYVFRGWVGKGQSFDEMDGAFLASIGSFHPLRADERALAESLKIQVRKARRGDSFARLARSSRIPNHPESQLRLLNGMYPDGEISRGQMLKVVY